MSRLNDLLHSLQSKLPSYTYRHGAKAPVFIIDEANELRSLLKDVAGHDALHNFFKLFILDTKELGSFTYF